MILTFATRSRRFRDNWVRRSVPDSSMSVRMAGLTPGGFSIQVFAGDIHYT